jgi:hypothetical protein
LPISNTEPGIVTSLVLPSVEDQGKHGEDGQSEGGREGHYKRHEPEDASCRRKASASHTAKGSLVLEPRPPGERKGDERQDEPEGDRRRGLSEPHLVEQSPRRCRADKHPEGEQREHEGPDGSGIPHRLSRGVDEGGIPPHCLA